jgi:hypothetical protein
MLHRPKPGSDFRSISEEMGSDNSNETTMLLGAAGCDPNRGQMQVTDPFWSDKRLPSGSPTKHRSLRHLPCKTYLAGKRVSAPP